MEEFWFFLEKPNREKGRGFLEELWSIDITGYMREDFPLKQTLQTHLGPHYYLSKVEFYVKYT